jgi:acetolactate synthase-1/3 small subunit
MNELKKKADIHTISILVANKPGVLVRCAQVFARRGFNIDSLVVSVTTNPKFSRMTITAQGDPGTLDQIIKQTAKLIDVIHVAEHTGVDAITKEFALVKIKFTPAKKAGLVNLLKKFKASISYQDKTIAIIEQAGTTDELDLLEAELKKYSILEMVRSGKLVMAKGKETT